MHPPRRWSVGSDWRVMDIDPEHRPDDWPRHHDMSVGEAFGRISEQLHREHEHTDHQLRRIMSSQDQVNADVTQLTAAVDQINGGLDAINAEIASLQGQGVDVTALQSAVQSVSDAAGRVAAVAPTTPAPAPAPSPEPVPAPAPEPAPAEPPTNPTF